MNIFTSSSFHLLELWENTNDSSLFIVSAIDTHKNWTIWFMTQQATTMCMVQYKTLCGYFLMITVWNTFSTQRHLHYSLLLMILMRFCKGLNAFALTLRKRWPRLLLFYFPWFFLCLASWFYLHFLRVYHYIEGQFPVLLTPMRPFETGNNKDRRIQHRCHRLFLSKICAACTRWRYSYPWMSSPAYL